MDKCTRNGCNRAGDDIGTCIDAQTIIGCSRPVPVDPKKDLVMRCMSCDKTMAFSIDDIMHGRVDRPACQGAAEKCLGVIYAPPASKK